MLETAEPPPIPNLVAVVVWRLVKRALDGQPRRRRNA